MGCCFVPTRLLNFGYPKSGYLWVASVFTESTERCTLVAVAGSFVACFVAKIGGVDCWRFVAIRPITAVGRRSCSGLAVEGSSSGFTATGVFLSLFAPFESFTGLGFCPGVSG